MKDTIAQQIRWLKYHLQTNAIHREPAPAYPPSQHPSGWCAIAIPDWDVEQRIQELEESLAN